MTQSFIKFWNIFAYIFVQNIIYWNFMKLVITEGCPFKIQMLYLMNEKLVGWNNS